jgi:phosphate-selective porin
MTLTTTLRRVVAAVALAAVASTAALAGTASAASVEKTAVLAPGATIPVDFPGYREPANNRLKGGYRIVVVDAALARDEKTTTTITAPKGFRLVTLAFDRHSQLGGRTENVYVGKRSVRLTLFADRNHVAPGQVGHATIYALARRGGF